MRILHTSDWHVGKKLGRYDRNDEYAHALDEVIGIAESEQVDLVIVSGDLFDRPSPPMWALSMVIDRLQRLARDRPVVAVAGNHDSGELFEVLAPLLAPYAVHLVGTIKRPEEGGVLAIDTAAGSAYVACFPFLREGQVVDFMAATERWYGVYADRVRDLAKAYADAAVAAAGSKGVALMAAHFMVTGVSIGGHGVPRGERQLHIGKAYSATEHAIPPTLSYVAMGHIHAPQPVPHAPIPAEYAGSLLELDFGEAGEKKRVVIVDVEPGLPAVVRSVPLHLTRRLIRATGTWEQLEARGDLSENYVDLRVETEGPDPGLADRARQAFPLLVRVEAVYPRAESDFVSRSGMALDDLYAAFVRADRGIEEVPADLLAAFRSVHDAVGMADQ